MNSLDSMDPHRSTLPLRRRAGVYGFMGASAILALATGVIEFRGAAPWSNNYYAESFDLPSSPLEPSPLSAEPSVMDTAAMNAQPSFDVPPVAEVASREPEATVLGYRAEVAWSERAIADQETFTIAVSTVPGVDYWVLARTLPGCDVDAIVSDDISDTSPDADASVHFEVVGAGTVGIFTGAGVV